MLLFILGAHRSGTSAAAGLLSALGFNAGKILLPADKFNAKGYFEPKSVVSLNENFLSKLGSSWSDVAPIEATSLDALRKPEHLAALRQVLSEEFAGASDAVIKDPRLCRLLPLWQHVFAEQSQPVNYLITLRPPEDVIRSLMRRDRLGGNHAALLYVIHLLDAERHTRDGLRALAPYQDLLADPRSVLQNLDRVFGTDLSCRDPQVLESALAFISQELNHADADIDLPSSPSLDLARRVFSEFQAGIDPKRQAVFERLQHDYQALLASLEPWLSQARLFASLRHEIFLPGRLMNEAGAEHATATVYWGSTSVGYIEANTIKIPYRLDTGVQTLNFVFPEGLPPLTRLRLDVTDRPAFVELIDLALLDQQGQVFGTYEGSQVFQDVSPDMKPIREIDGHNHFWLVTGFDPHGQLALPQDLLARISGGWSLRVRVVIQLLVQGVSPLWQRYEDLWQHYQQTHQHILRLEQEATEKQRVLAELSENMVAKERVVSELRREMLRAEAQLSLLKDLMLDDKGQDRI